MISPAACLLYTQDPELVRRTRAFLRNRASVRHLDDPERLEAVLQQNSPALLVLDLRCHETRDLLEQVKAEWPDVLIIALGVPRSEPLRDAEQAGIYAAEDVNLERRPFQALDRSGARTFARPGRQSRSCGRKRPTRSRRVEPRELAPSQDTGAGATLRLLRFPEGVSSL